MFPQTNELSGVIQENIDIKSFLKIIVLWLRFKIGNTQKFDESAIEY